MFMKCSKRICHGDDLDLCQMVMFFPPGAKTRTIRKDREKGRKSCVRSVTRAIRPQDAYADDDEDDGSAFFGDYINES